MVLITLIHFLPSSTADLGCMGSSFSRFVFWFACFEADGERAVFKFV